MRGGALPPALLFSAFGLALAGAPRRYWASSLATLVITAATLSLADIAPRFLDLGFLGCWMSVITCAAAVHRSDAIGRRGILALSLNAGFWAGAVIALAGSQLDLLKSLPAVILLLPAASILDRRLPVAVKMVSSWLIAIAVLAATLQLLPVTPGYLPDHLE